MDSTWAKKNFRRFDIDIDLDALRREVSGIAPDEWLASYWGDTHCSVGMLLLRGGDSGTQEDFYASRVSDHPLLGRLPEVNRLLSPGGPFGGATYAFLFRMRPNGITRLHKDTMDRWHDMYRIHVPIITNPEAFLVADGKSIHFAAGAAWTFDNQSSHGVVNGPEERIHLIFDVDLNDTLKQRIIESTVLPGEANDMHMKRIQDSSMSQPSYFGDPVVLSGIRKLRQSGLSTEQIVEFFNRKKVPTRRYYEQRWSADMISDLEANGDEGKPAAQT